MDRYHEEKYISKIMSLYRQIRDIESSPDAWYNRRRRLKELHQYSTILKNVKTWEEEEKEREAALNAEFENKNHEIGISINKDDQEEV